MPAKRTTFSLLLVSLMACFSLRLGSALPQPEGRILGGEDVTSGEYPWVASLRLNKVHTCSAAIISQTQLLTAAHCVSSIGTTPVDVSQVVLRVGSTNQYAGGSLVSVSKILIHPQYGNFLHDIALLTLTSPLTFGEKVNKIDLPDADESSGEGSGDDTDADTAIAEELPNGTPVYVTGWGETADGSVSYKLQKTSFNTVSSQLCELYAGYGYPSALCLSSAEGEGVCRGDAGAGVITDDQKLEGIVSFFFGNCGTKYPDIASRIAYYLSWIEENAA